MKSIFKFTRIIVALSLLAPGAVAQKTETPKKPVEEKISHTEIKYGAGVEHFQPFTSQVRTQMRDLGIGPYDVIPSGQSAITSLAVAPNGYIFGGTTGEVANLFVFSPDHNMVFPLGTIPGQESIYHSLAFGKDGMLYLGTSLDPTRVYNPDESIVQGTNYFHKSVTIQIMEAYKKYPGGHIYRYNPSSARYRYYQPDWPINKPAKVEDLGIPVANEGIHTLLRDRNSDLVFGITYPNGLFFQFDPATRKSKVITRLISNLPQGHELTLFSKSLVQDLKGNIYANTEDGFLVKYNPADGKLDTLEIQIPGIKGRSAFNRIECSVMHSSGSIFGGTTDGYLFCFNPENMQMLNFGKPFMETIIRAVTTGLDGNIYGVGGEDLGVGRLFKYDLNTHSFCDLGIIQVTHVPYQEWTGLVFDAIVTGMDGSLYLGNSEHKSKLFIYNPQ